MEGHGIQNPDYPFVSINLNGLKTPGQILSTEIITFYSTKYNHQFVSALGHKNVTFTFFVATLSSDLSNLLIQNSTPVYAEYTVLGFTWAFAKVYCLVTF